MIFQSSCTILHVFVWGFVVLHPFQKFCYQILYFSHFNNLMLPFYFNLHFSNDKWFFMCIFFGILISHYFLIGLFASNCWVLSVFKFFMSFIRYVFCGYFLPVHGLSFHILSITFYRAKTLVLIKLNLMISS